MSEKFGYTYARYHSIIDQSEKNSALYMAYVRIFLGTQYPYVKTNSSIRWHASVTDVLDRSTHCVKRYRSIKLFNIHELYVVHTIERHHGCD